MDSLPRTVKDTVWNGIFLARRLTAPARRLPDYLIVGAQRSGTSSLHEYLIDHPRILAPYTKEVRFFDLNYGKGVPWYRAYFPTSVGGFLRGTRFWVGEATPYYLYHPLVAERIAETLPDVRLVFLLRNPVDRAISHYNHEVKWGHEDRPIEEALDPSGVSLHHEEYALRAGRIEYSYVHHHYGYLDRGRYERQVKRYLDLFPPDRMLFIQSEELFSRPGEVYGDVLGFLGVPESQRRTPDFKTHNPGRYHREEPPSLRDRLRDFYSACNQNLSDMIGREITWA